MTTPSHPSHARPVISAIDPMPAEPAAYALGMFSRSAGSLEDNLRYVHQKNTAQFYEQFYWSYGHASLGDLTATTSSTRGVSSLAAIELEDDQLWGGQEQSSRYQDMTTPRYVLPTPLAGSSAEDTFHTAIHRLYHAYQTFLPRIIRQLQTENPRPDTLSIDAYDRAIKARAFDVVRYFLPLAQRTNVGQVLTLRVLERQIRRMLASPFEELRWIGGELRAMCGREPDHTWNDLNQRASDPGPLAPTLVKHCDPTPYQLHSVSAVKQAVSGIMSRFQLDNPQTWGPARRVDLIRSHTLEDELITTLLYRVTHAPYSHLLDHVTPFLPVEEKRALLQAAHTLRGPHDEFSREFNVGYALIFDLLMDIGAWRDIHRHRRCQQIRQDFTPLHGFETPPMLDRLQLTGDYTRVMDHTLSDTTALLSQGYSDAVYLLPFGAKVRCLIKCDLGEALYLTELRSKPHGHWSYREVAWDMKELITERYPECAPLFRVTAPTIEAPLKR